MEQGLHQGSRGRVISYWCCTERSRRLCNRLNVGTEGPKMSRERSLASAGWRRMVLTVTTNVQEEKGWVEGHSIWTWPCWVSGGNRSSKQKSQASSSHMPNWQRELWELGQMSVFVLVGIETSSCIQWDGVLPSWGSGLTFSSSSLWAQLAHGNKCMQSNLANYMIAASCSLYDFSLENSPLGCKHLANHTTHLVKLLLWFFFLGNFHNILFHTLSS